MRRAERKECLEDGKRVVTPMLAECVRLIRVYHGKTQEQTADMIGKFLFSVQLYERAKMRVSPKIQRLYAKAFKMPLSSITLFDDTKCKHRVRRRIALTTPRFLAWIVRTAGEEKS